MNGIRLRKTLTLIAVAAIAGIIACGGVIMSLCDNNSLQWRSKPSLLIVAILFFSVVALWFAKRRGLLLEWIFHVFH